MLTSVSNNASWDVPSYLHLPMSSFRFLLFICLLFISDIIHLYITDHVLYYENLWHSAVHRSGINSVVLGAFGKCKNASKYPTQQHSVFARSQRYLLVAQTHEIEGDTLHVSQECNIHSQFLSYTYSRLCARSLHTRRNGTRVKSPDACNAFFIKVPLAPRARSCVRC